MHCFHPQADASQTAVADQHHPDGPIYATRTDHACSGSYRFSMVLSHGLTPAACTQRRHAQRLEVGSCLQFAYCNASLLPSLPVHGAVASLIPGTSDPTDSARFSRRIVTFKERDFHPSSGPFRAWLSCFHASHGTYGRSHSAEFMVFLLHDNFQD